MDYYDYMLFHVDDCLIANQYLKEALDKLSKYFPLKPSSVGLPNIYLGGKLMEVILPNGVKAWSISGSKYVQEAIANLEKELCKRVLQLTTKKVNSPLSAGYCQECDVLSECNENNMQQYTSLIGILRQVVEIGHLNLIREINMIASYHMMSHEGHLE